MNRLWIPAALRKAKQEDLITPLNSHNPVISERVRDNNVTFLYCHDRKRFVGVQKFWSHQDLIDVLRPFWDGQLYVFNEKMDMQRADFIFEMAIDEATGDDLKELPWLLKLGLPYFILQENQSVSGPHYLSTSTDPNQLAQLLATRSIYLVSKHQKFREIPAKKTA